eukprot:GEMP01009490.1.p1 GENE.GEMP01009490.1~~GEMP01009490.1.p1  ORF type:complete len:380 (-),score=60.94 GEMP01009490.1:2284-3360(-)
MVIFNVAAVLWSTGAALSFGVADSFADSLNKDFPESEHVPIAMQLATWFIVGGMVSMLYSILAIFKFQRRCSTSLILNYKGTLFENRLARKHAIMQSVVSAVGYVAAVVLSTMGFKAVKYDEEDVGLLNAIIVTHLIIVAVLCHFWLKEHMTLLQWLTVLVAFAGIICLCVGDFLATNNKTVSDAFWAATPWAVGGSNGFVVSNLAIKHALEHDICCSSLNYLRMIVVICCGIICLIFTVLVDEKPFLHNPQVWGLVTGSGAIYGAGLVCLNYALSYECTALSLALFLGGSRIVIMFAPFIAGREKMPHTVKFVGGSIVVLALVPLLVLMCLSCRQREPKREDNEVNDFVKDADEIRR